MKKIVAVLISALTTLAPFWIATPASAACAMQYPTVGTIASVSTDANGYATIALNHADVFNPTGFTSNPGATTYLDKYNTFATAYKQNTYQVPSAYAYQFPAGSDAASIRSNLKSSFRLQRSKAFRTRQGISSYRVLLLAHRAGKTTLRDFSELPGRSNTRSRMIISLAATPIVKKVCRSLRTRNKPTAYRAVQISGRSSASKRRSIL